ncbi:MAG TPA: radical SAM protein [Firmicutes bacterium]|nr:radical SAM protein [Bacillota bacterium]
MTESPNRAVALYIHVPFCRARCLYCAFPSRPAGPDTQTLYVENISTEIERYFHSNPGWSVNTVYVGGGTPSTLNTADINLLLDTIHRLAPDATEIHSRRIRISTIFPRFRCCTSVVSTAFQWGFRVSTIPNWLWPDGCTHPMMR